MLRVVRVAQVTSWPLDWKAPQSAEISDQTVVLYVAYLLKEKEVAIGEKKQNSKKLRDYY